MSLVIGATSPLQGASGQGGGADLGDTIPQSLKFEGGQFLRWDSASQSGDDRTQWTHSMWVKLAQVGVEDCLFSGWQNSNNRFEITLRTTGALEVTEWGAGQAKVLRVTNRLFRDHSAWYHIVVVYDVDNSSNDDKMRVYINGKRETSFASTAEDPGWAGVFGDSGTDAVYGGKWNGSSITNGFDGYIALPIMLDGILVSEDADGYITEFGRPNSDGVWVPKDYTGSYGTNGWKLTLASSQTSDIGEDSGNNNNFTDSSFDKAATSSSNPHNDVDIKDTPTNNWVTLNRNNKTNGANPTSAGLFFEQTSNDQAAVGTQELTSGKWYFEVHKSNNQSPEIGICPSYVDFSNDSVVVAGGVSEIAMVTSNNTIIRNGNGGTDSVSYTDCNNEGTIGCAIDMDAKKIWWTDLNGNWQASGNPATGANANKDFSGLQCANGCVPYVALYTNTSHSFYLKFGQMDFVRTPPTGYKAIQSKEQPEPTIKDGRDHFGILTYPGSGNSQTISGLEFKPDFAWIKSTSDNTDHALFDVQRGIGKLRSNEPDAENNNNDGFASLANTGLNLDGTGSGGDVNTNGRSYVAWCWKAGGSATTIAANSITANTPTIAANVSANTDAGFSIVTWDATGATGSIAHGLNSTPEFIMIKALNRSASWVVWTPELAANHVLHLNTQDNQQNQANCFQATVVTDKLINLGTGSGADTNQDTTSTASPTHVAYCWHSVKGFSKFGKYAANGDPNGPHVFTGFAPAFVMVKVLSADDDWNMYDSTRSTGNPRDETIYGNTLGAQNANDSSHPIDFYANGFKIRTDNGQENGTGEEYVYMAFAENPFGGENAPPVTAR